MSNDAVQSGISEQYGDMCIHIKMVVQCKTEIHQKMFEVNLSTTNNV